MFEVASGTALVEAVHRDDVHRFSKTSQPSVRLLTGLGVEGDAHCGALVKHRSRVAGGPVQNLSAPGAPPGG